MHSPWGSTEARREKGWVSLFGASCLVSLFLQALWTSWSRKQLLSNVSAVSSGKITWLEVRFMHQRMLFLKNTGLYHLLGRSLCNPNALIEKLWCRRYVQKESAFNRSVTYLWLRLNDGCVWAGWLFPCWKRLTVGYKPLEMVSVLDKVAEWVRKREGDSLSQFITSGLVCLMHGWLSLRRFAYFQPSFNTTYTPNQGLMEHLENSSRCDMLVQNVYFTLE